MTSKTSLKALCGLAVALAASVSTFAQTTAKDFSAQIASANAGLPMHLDATTNLDELTRQYTQNREQWDAAIKWLAQNDLQGISAGKHPIEGSKLVASVEDSQNGMLENRASESHYHHIDLQLVVRGAEGFALLDHESSKPNTKWKEDVIRYDYDRTRLNYLIGFPGTMYLFFPSDWHIAKVQTPFADQTLRVIVIKLDYVE